MIDTLCRLYGSPLRCDEDRENATHDLFAFPTLAQLKNVSEEELRRHGFGYRAKFVEGCSIPFRRMHSTESLV